MTMFYGDDEDNENQRFKFEMKGTNELIIIGINPSTARADPKGTDNPEKDQTIRKIIGFLDRKRNSFGQFDGFLMLNVCAQSSVDPAKLQEAQNKKLHTLNMQKIDGYLQELSKKQKISVLLAYGDSIRQGKYLKNNLRDIITLLQKYSATFLRLGDLSKKHNPKHPLYLSYNTPLVEIKDNELKLILK